MPRRHETGGRAWRGWLGRYRAILLDLNGTFMFGHDRFQPGTDFAATYRAIGGRGLAPEMVNHAMARFLAAYGAMYGDPARQEDLAPVAKVMRDLFAGLGPEETGLLERVVAAHEIGRIPPGHAAALRRLARTHRLGIVSNLWSRSPPWRRELARCGLGDALATTVFSSEHGCVKPAPRLFRIALAELGLAASEVVFVGDDLRRDIAGASRAGMATIWIGEGMAPRDAPVLPDRIVADILELTA